MMLNVPISWLEWIILTVLIKTEWNSQSCLNTPIHFNKHTKMVFIILVWSMRLSGLIITSLFCPHSKIDNNKNWKKKKKIRKKRLNLLHLLIREAWGMPLFSFGGFKCKIMEINWFAHICTLSHRQCHTVT